MVATILAMSTKHDIGRAKRRWEQQVGPTLDTVAAIDRYRTTLDGPRNAWHVDAGGDPDAARHLDSMYTGAAAAIDTWRTQGAATYLVDDELYAELAATPFPDDATPHEVFRRRPHAVPLFVYADPPRLPLILDEGQPPEEIVFRGFLVYPAMVNDASNVLTPNLRMLTFGQQESTGRTLSVTFEVPLGEFHVTETDGSLLRIADATTVDLAALTAYDAAQFANRPHSEQWPGLNHLFHAAVNLLLYVSASEPDLDEVPIPTVGGRRVLPAKTPAVHRLGYRVGAVLRTARTASHAGAGTGPAVTPHLRRAHWHRYWTGPRTGERKLVLRWVSQTFVNADHDEYVPAVRPLPKSA